MKPVVPRYGDEADEPGIVRVAGRPVPGDPEDRMVGWRAMHRAVLARGCATATWSMSRPRSSRITPG
ncbi:MAG: hypothetical protein MZV70_72135 [Desulfobacterales bacterium]|nr:hypothetical protein [Desulfobacterales bacterium]